MLEKERETAAKMAARAFAQSYLDDLVPSVFGLLDEQGFFYDAAERGSISLSVSISASVLVRCIA